MKSPSSGSPWQRELLLSILIGFVCAWGPLIDHFLHPDSQCLYPFLSWVDGGGYNNLLLRASQGPLQGDPTLWEHRIDPASIFTVHTHLASLCGVLLNWWGFDGLFWLSTLLSGVSVFLLLRVNRLFGQALPYAFAAACSVSFFAVMLGANLHGYGLRNILGWTLSISDHRRLLYPEVSSYICTYGAIGSLAWCLWRRSFVWAFFSAVVVSLNSMVRPTNWMVLCLFIGVLALWALARRDWVRLRLMVLTGVLTILGGLPFLLSFSHYMGAHRDAFIDQGVRGAMQVKLWPHYVKYSLLAVGWMGFLIWLKPRNGGTGRSAEGAPLPSEEDFGAQFLLCLVAASLLAHFSTLRDGVTRAGIGYFLIHAIVPFSMMAFFHLFWMRWNRRYPDLFKSVGWGVAILTLLVWQQLDLGLTIRKDRPEYVIPASRLALYKWISAQTPRDAVILSPLASTEVVEFTGRYAFLPAEITDCYVSSAPTSELLDRFLLFKLLATGRVSDLAPLFQPEGIDVWALKLNGEQTRWLNFLKSNIGASFFEINPLKQRGELRIRNLELPASRRSQVDLVIYFDESMRRIFQRYAGLEEPVPPGKVIQLIRQRYKANYILLPRPDAALDQRLGTDPDFKLLTTPSQPERLWVVP